MSTPSEVNYLSHLDLFSFQGQEMAESENAFSECLAIAPGGTQVQRGAAPSLRISRKKGSLFKTSACPRFCKRRVLFCTQVRSLGVKIPLQSTKDPQL